MTPEAFPWVRFLPREDAQAFLAELDGPAQVITAWRHTAEIHADPELLAVLTQDAEDHGVVSAPPG